MDNKVLQKVDAFFTQFHHQIYKKGEILIRADESPVGIFYLKMGTVKEYAITKSGEELVINIFKPVVFFPMSFAFNSRPNKYYYEAIDDLDIWRAPKNDVIAFVKKNPDVLYDLTSRVFNGIDGMVTRMTYLMSGNAYARLLIELLIYAKRFGKKQNTIEISITEKEIAAQSGMTRETVSREIKILKENGLISVNKNKLIINNIQKLEEELGEGV